MTGEKKYATLLDVNRVVAGVLVERTKPQCLAVLSSFIEGRETTQVDDDDENLPLSDDLSVIVSVLCSKDARKCLPTVRMLLTVIKICSRKQSNQITVHRGTITTLLNHLEAGLTDQDYLGCVEATAALSNYTSNKNISSILITAIPQYNACLKAGNIPLLETSCSALQGLTMQVEAKRGAVEQGTLHILLSLLHLYSDGESDSATLLSILGALHNISTHISSPAVYRETDSIALIVGFLENGNGAVRRAAAGIIQSLSREAESLQTLASFDASLPLTNLLSDPDVATQVASLQALLNMHGSCIEASQNRDAFKSVLACVIASSALRDSYCPQP
eukprot:TRINITY_DN33939_c0_g1_i1.p1 TRINITY_DN33939_c0_g1~~TRINITY_DN33939_c0_g1_i1.p1  ORF type:complete len:334 (+),score=27.82 TRINITY_DN33939_c0_g1_i1:29-1030(+)